MSLLPDAIGEFTEDTGGITMPETDDYGRHEVMHMSLFLAESIESALLKHTQIKNNPEWLQLAEKAHRNLFDLYQSIGAEHMGVNKK